jgi:tetratricopeptide (TPR) repeat protein
LALEDLGHGGWIDSRELRGGDPLWTEISKAIEDASGYAVVVSPDALQSKWVGKELRCALELRDERGKDKFPVIPLSLDGTKLGVLEDFFGEEPVYIAASSAAGGVEAAMDALLVAMGKRLPADGNVDTTPTPGAKPLEELVLDLTDLTFHEEGGKRRASARARLVHQPATSGQRKVESAQQWRLVAPIGPIEAGELAWYLEKYAVWPSRESHDRAKNVEAHLQDWGRALHDAAMPVAHTANVLQSWAQIDDHAGRRFSVHVNAAVVVGTPDAERKLALEAAAELLRLPWELLHDNAGYLFQGARPMRVRRRLPNANVLDVPVVAPPIRVLLVTARPEDDSCVYIDHRASALPLVEAMEALPGLVRIHVLSPPTLPALRDELDSARMENRPYHVVHVDGPGVYDRRVGLGGLCFELPEDTGKLEQRRHVTVFTDELGPLLRDHRIPLVFLQASQATTAQAVKASESVASEFLKVGVASVVAMSHGVLVETARRFVAAFYHALAAGKRVGDAMLAGQRQLKDDTFRGRVFGEGELRLEDWFVPMLFQEEEDPQLFRTARAKQTPKDVHAALSVRLGELPPAPATGFIGRSRELLALQRLLRHERYAVVRGQAGEGKTALAAEFARWMVRSHQVRRAAFVSVEAHGQVAAVVDTLGRQLVGRDYSAATFGDLEEAILPIERVLAEQATLLVVDNMESILLPPFIDLPEALSEDARRELDAILQVCARLNANGVTRLVFTSREALPAPFDADRHRRELHQLHPDDAVKQIERVLDTEGVEAGPAKEASRGEIEQLVEAVHGHARTLALLAPALRSRGVAETRLSLVELMAEMEKAFPGSREKSVFASIELSLRRLSDANRDRAHVLGVFHGRVDLDALRAMMEWEAADVDLLAVELVKTGLATPDRFNHLTLNPALCPYLRAQMDAAERAALTVRWVEAMRAYTEFLVQQQRQNAEVAATLTLLELPNLFALLDLVRDAADAEATIDLATSLYNLLQGLDKPRLLARVAQVRDAEAAALGDVWNHARFEASRTRIDQRLGGGKIRAALEEAQQLLQRAQAAGEQAYPSADYDVAMAVNLLGQVLHDAGRPEQALPLFNDARQRFESIAEAQANEAAESMVSACVSRQGDCLRDLGRLDDAAKAYEEGIRREEQRGADRGVAMGKGQLGAVRLLQRRYPEALTAYAESRERFTQLDDPGGVAMVWHQIGRVYEAASQLEPAEDAYRKSLAIQVRLGNVAGQASTLAQLGNLHANTLGRPEEAVAFITQAADKYVEIGDIAGEGRQRVNIANTLRKLHRLDEARQQIHRAIQCNAQSGDASQPWRTWAVLGAIETDAGNASAAAEAKSRATASYLAYRHAGGENHEAAGRLSLVVSQSLLAGDPAGAASFLRQLASEPNAAWLGPFIHALQAIIAGSRDRSLADAPNLTYMMTAEILLLIEALEEPA